MSDDVKNAVAKLKRLERQARKRIFWSGVACFLNLLAAVVAELLRITPWVIIGWHFLLAIVAMVVCVATAERYRLLKCARRNFEALIARRWSSIAVDHYTDQAHAALDRL